MAKTPEIRTRSFVHKGGELVELSTLPPEERREVGLRLAQIYLNTLFAGQAVFSLPKEKTGS